MTPRPSQTFTREQWAAFVQDRWEDIVERFYAIAVYSIKDVLTPDTVANAILKKGKRFGPLKLEEMDLDQELMEELVDALAYLSGSMMRDG